jgi:hypothetical protein
MSDGNRVSKPDVMKTRRDNGMTSGFVSKLIFSVFYNLLFFGGMLFLPAGTFDWPRAWAFLGVLFVATIATMVIVFPGREDLLNERFKPPLQKGQPVADKIIVLSLIASFKSTKKEQKNLRALRFFVVDFQQGGANYSKNRVKRR